MKRILTFLLSVLLICGSAGCRCVTSATGKAAWHTDLSFSELSDSGFNAALETARAKELLFRIERGELSGVEAQKKWDERADAFRRLETDASIAYVRYCIDVTDAENKRNYDTLSAQLDELECVLVDTALLLSNDPALRERYDPDTVESLRLADALSDDSVLPLFARERALIGEYEALSDSLKTEFRGREWTGDEILSDPTLSAEDFAFLYESYLALFNAEAGSLFLKLVDVRREIAKTLGFASYADYAYACFQREYSPRDAARLSGIVKTDLVPFFKELAGDYLSSAGRLFGTVFEQEPTMERIGSAVKDVLPELSDPWAYMLSHGMYDLGTGFSRMPGSFTAYFAAYGTPFLFSSWTNGFEMPPTVIHEFGHFSAYYLNEPAFCTGASPDLAEIDAQGLELLTVLRYDTLYGDLSKDAETVQLFYALYALIDGCVEDAFQQYAYERDDLTLEALNAEYGRLCAEYGLDLIGTEARSWTQIPHTFQSPFYYISYAASMTAALELYLICCENPIAARNAYLAILMRDPGAHFSETLTAAGLKDPFAEETIKDTAIGLGSVRRVRMNE